MSASRWTSAAGMIFAEADGIDAGILYQASQSTRILAYRFSGLLQGIHSTFKQRIVISLKRLVVEHSRLLDDVHGNASLDGELHDARALDINRLEVIGLRPTDQAAVPPFAQPFDRLARELRQPLDGEALRLVHALMIRFEEAG